MRHIVVGTLLGALLSAPAGAQQRSAAEQAVLKAVRELDEAQLIKKDRAAMERLMASEYQYGHSNGTVANKAQDIAESMSPGQNWTAITHDDLKVRIYGNVAIVTGTSTLTGSAKGYASGARRFTDIWIKRDGRWQNLGGQSTLVSAK